MENNQNCWYASATCQEVASFLTRMVSGITVGNIFAVVFAAGLNTWGKVKQPFE